MKIRFLSIFVGWMDGGRTKSSKFKVREHSGCVVESILAQAACMSFVSAQMIATLHLNPRERIRESTCVLE